MVENYHQGTTLWVQLYEIGRGTRLNSSHSGQSRMPSSA